MKFKVLGCSGGIGEKGERTTSFLVDDDILIDCGTGVGDLSLDALMRIDHVFLTHSHMDHIASLPLLVDVFNGTQHLPLTVYALEETIQALRKHIFNWVIWPDFTEIPNCQHPLLRFQAVQTGQPIRLGERVITGYPVQHSVPSLAYCLDSGQGKLFFTGDTACTESLINTINQQTGLRHLVIEAAFSDKQRELAMMSEHLCPELLGEILDRITLSTGVYITHLKPGAAQEIMSQIESNRRFRQISRLPKGLVLEF